MINEEEEKENKNVSGKNTLNDLSGKEWIQETKSFFFQRGLGKNSPEAKYEKMHPAPFSYTDIIKLIQFFTKTGGKVLDPFSGTGSTIKACLELNREGYGVEIEPKWCDVSKTRLECESKHVIDSNHLICGDSRNLKKIFKPNFFDFIVTSPPYWNILEKKDHKAKMREKEGKDTKYSTNPFDIGNIDNYETFLDELGKILFSCYDVLKEGKYMCVIVSDFRNKSEYISFHSDIIKKITNKKLKKHFELKGIKILLQNAKKLFPYGYPFSYVENIHHQYVLIFSKQKRGK